jgi:hypothetical protein
VKKVLIIGATSAIAEHCARIWATRGDALFLVARNDERVNSIATDLKVRGATSIATYALDLNAIDQHEAVLDAADKAMGGIDTVLIAHGTLSNQKQCEKSVALTLDEITTNALSAISLLTLIANRLEDKKQGTIAVISSVAGDRGRKSNYVYGAAKGLITRFTQGLQHRFANTKVKVVLIKPGPTDTPMTAHLKGGGANLAPVQGVSKQIVGAIDKGKPVIYTPSKWWLIMMIIRHLPKFIFDKMDI